MAPRARPFSGAQTPDLFQAAAEQDTRLQPLAERLRPKTLDAFVGQQHLLGPRAILQRMFSEGFVPSMILWGPPGTGKTTLARLAANHCTAYFETLSAVMTGLKELRQVVENAEHRRNHYRQKTLLFVDEIHRYNKTQQDALLPHIESGLLILIGATTENPSFELTPALLSRCRLFVLKALGTQDVVRLLQRAVTHLQSSLKLTSLHIDPRSLEVLANNCQGDARHALTTFEMAVQIALAEQASTDLQIQPTHIQQAHQKPILQHDKNGDKHYDITSAFIKSMRASDPDAAIYYMTRMLKSGESPRFVLRRMVIFASEDIGHADPQALQVAVAATSAFELLGLPEANFALIQAASYLACAPKSNTVLRALRRAEALVEAHGSLAIPLHLRQASTPLMRQMGHGRNYRYPHDVPYKPANETNLPQELVAQVAQDSIFSPRPIGFEKNFCPKPTSVAQDTPISESK